MQDIAERAKFVFGQARDRIAEDCNQINADLSAKGAFGGSATATLAIRAFQTRSSEALKQLLGEVAKAVEHRGRAWAKVMGTLSGALEEQIASAPQTLSKSLGVIRTISGSGERAINDLIAKAGEDLRAELAEFRDGWTAPRAKRWTERHPVIYALFLLVIGTIAGAVATYVLPSK